MPTTLSVLWFFSISYRERTWIISIFFFYDYDVYDFNIFIIFYFYFLLILGVVPVLIVSTAGDTEISVRSDHDISSHSPLKNSVEQNTHPILSTASLSSICSFHGVSPVSVAVLSSRSRIPMADTATSNEFNKIIYDWIDDLGWHSCYSSYWSTYTCMYVRDKHQNILNWFLILLYDVCSLSLSVIMFCNML